MSAGELAAYPIAKLGGAWTIHLEGGKVPATMQAVFQFWGTFRPAVKDDPIAKVRVRAGQTGFMHALVAFAKPFRMPVQLVLRPTHEFRGYAGQVAAGTVRRGDELRRIRVAEELCQGRPGGLLSRQNDWKNAEAQEQTTHQTTPVRRTGASGESNR